MKLVFSETQKNHHPRHFLSNGQAKPSPEVPERADRLLAAAQEYGLNLVQPDDYGLSPIAAIHTPEYLQFLAGIHARWQTIPGASEEVIPNVHPDRREGVYPSSPVGQAGYHLTDTACPISAQTWESVRWSANTAVHSAQLVLHGEQAVYGLCRPPGHHAFADLAGGFCYLNNSAIAAQALRAQHQRIAIIDVDLHHGNGTQGIFYARSDVLTVSVHADPDNFYPFFWGHAAERGHGPGLGYNLNFPLPRHSGDEVFLTALEQGLARVRSFAPTAIVVALGLDAFEGDPFGGLAVTTQGFARIAEKIAALKLPTVMIQEGGYLCDELGANLQAFLGGFRGI